MDIEQRVEILRQMIAQTDPQPHAVVIKADSEHAQIRIEIDVVQECDARWWIGLLKTWIPAHVITVTDVMTDVRCWRLQVEMDVLP